MLKLVAHLWMHAKWIRLMFDARHDRVSSRSGKAGKKGIFRRNAGKAGKVYDFWQWKTGKAWYFWGTNKCLFMILQYCALALLINILIS